MLQLKDASPNITAEILVSPKDIDRAEQVLEEIFQLSSTYYGSEAANPEMSGSPPSALDDLRRRTLLREMMVGPPAYHHHWQSVLEGLFGPPHVGRQLAETCGFDLHSALSCCRAIVALMLEALAVRSRSALASEEQIKKTLTRYMETGKFEGDPQTKPMFDSIRNMRSKERKRFIFSISRSWITVALTDVLAFMPGTLAAKAGVPEEVAGKFLHAFSLSFGSTPADYLMPTPTPRVRVCPIVALGENFICPLPFNLIWAIKPRFEEALKGSQRWNSYQKHRGNFLVGEGLKLVHKMLPRADAYEGLRYPIGPGQEGELDALILFDRYLFLLEAKGGEFGAARRGGKEGMKKGLAELVGDPLEQGARAWDYIRKTEHPVLVAKDGRRITIDKGQYTEVSIITLTLDSLDVFTPEMHTLREAGVLGQHDIPWAVCLTDLMVLSDIMQFPSEFTHFLRWRRSAGKAGGVSVGMDELNWLAIYLAEGPKRIAVPEGYDNLFFTSYTDDFDAYFDYQGGLRTQPASRPSQPIPRPLRELLDVVESTGTHGFTAVTEAFLDLTFEEREQIGEKLSSMSKGRGGAADIIKVDTPDLSLTLLRGDKTPGQLQEQISSANSVSKRSLAIAMDYAPALRVHGWFLQDPRQSATM